MALKALDARIASTAPVPPTVSGGAGPSSSATSGPPLAASSTPTPKSPEVAGSALAPPPLKTQISSKSVKDGEQKSDKLKD